MVDDTELDRLEKRLVGGGWIDSATFEQLMEKYGAYKQARIRHSLWPKLSPVAFVETIRPRLSFVAAAAMWNIPSDKAEDICAAAAKDFGREFFEFESLDHPVRGGLPVGETLVEMGVVSGEDLQTVLELQRQIEEVTGVRILLGILLVRHNAINLGAYFQALAIHFGLEASHINDELLEAVEAAWLTHPVRAR